MKPVFISYSRDDSDFVNRLRDDLRANGVNVWLDQTGLKPGTRNWEQALRDALRDARALVLVATPSSRQSNYVQGELEIAEMYNCPVYPVWAAGEEWADCIPLALIKMQYIDARGDAYDAAVPQLVAALGQAPVVVGRPEPEVAPDWEPRNPYKGLRAFREDDAGDFFGRETLIEELIEALRERMENDRLLAVIGPSGSGKSSVVMAGLLPRLREDALPGSAEWVYLDPMVPGARPLESLCTTLANALPQKSNAVIRQDLDDPEGRGLHLLARQITRQADQKLLLLIDQFEELFTQGINDDKRRQFITLLTAAVSETKGPMTVILTLRADFYDRPMEYPALFDLLQTHQAVPPMSIDDLRDVIEEPAALPDVQLTFEEGLVGDLLFEVREQVGGLPLLQFTLDQLFEQRDDHTLTLAAYQEMGGLQGALARHAEATYEGLPSDEHRRLARTLFLRLIEPGPMEQDTTRRRANMTELELPDAAQTQVLRDAADAFVQARLLMTGEISGRGTIEVSHEALIREWERLGTWLHDAREDVRLQKTVSADAAEWARRGRRPDDDMLYRGTVLDDAQAWMRRNAASVDEVAFIEASAKAETARKAEERRIARKVQNFRRASIVLGAVFVLALVATLVAALTAQSAQDDRAQAETQLADVQQLQATAAWQATYFALEQGRIATLAAGGILVPETVNTQAPADFHATLTQIATLNGWEPVIEEDDFGVEMVQVPPGCFWMGSMYATEEQPVHEVCFDEPFWIDRYEVTNAEYQRFIEAGGYDDERYWTSAGWDWKQENDITGPADFGDLFPSNDRPQQPRTKVSWYEAIAYTFWRGCQLPAEAQWEYAARGPDSLLYPWGKGLNMDNVRCCGLLAGPADAGSMSGGVSWVGAYDMSGNAWEWVFDGYDDSSYIRFAGRVVVNPQGPVGGSQRVLRGGSFESDFARASVRKPGARDLQDFDFGFRCARLNGP